jgi:hypothetical protein
MAKGYTYREIADKALHRQWDGANARGEHYEEVLGPPAV